VALGLCKNNSIIKGHTGINNLKEAQHPALPLKLSQSFNILL